MDERKWEGRPSELPAVAGPIYWDTETSKLHPDDGGRVSVVSAGWIDWTGDGTIWYAAWPFAQGTEGKPEDDGDGLLSKSQANGEAGVNLPEGEWWAMVFWLQTAGCGLIGQNVKFDLAMERAGVDGLREGTAGWTGVDLSSRIIWDTQIASRELDPLQSGALKGTGSISERGWGYVDAEKQALKPYLGKKTDPRYDLVPWSVMEPYAAMDALLTAKAHLWQLARLDAGECAHAGQTAKSWIYRELAVMKVLAAMERRGVPFDRAGALEAAAEGLDRQAKLEVEHEWLGSAAETTQHFFGSSGLGLAPYGTTPTGKIQLTGEIVDQMIQDEVEGAQALQDHNKLGTAVTKWYGPYAHGTGSDGRLRTVFRQVASGFEGEGGTASGRFSVERVNLQAIPQDYRLSDYEALVGIATPRELIGAAACEIEGWRLWELDLAQAELRVAALWAKCERMLSAIRNGDDLHGLTAAALFGVEKGDRAWPAMRQVAKRGNFSLIFGSGWLTFQRMVKRETGIKLSDSEAQRVVYEWRALYPEFKRAINWHSRFVDEHGYVMLANGRRRWFKAYEDQHKAFNQRVQASIAELGKDWMIATETMLNQEGVGSDRHGMLITIHDSQVLLLPDDADGQYLARRAKQAGEALWGQMFDGVPGEIEAKLWTAGVAA